jgi:EAL domain-containing protein (putative c-di-GMP-specific phosphodiesterase class I)
MLVNDVESTITKMSQLITKGLKFSLDDFGTGYSSLSYLKRLPLDQLKIDKSFIRDLLADNNSGAIAQAIIALGHAMGLGVIAEGVETDRQRDVLSIMGCNSFQGYLFSTPQPLDEFEKSLVYFPKSAEMALSAI